MVLAGGAADALLLGHIFFFYKRRRAKPAEGEVPLATSTAGLSQTSPGENSVFRQHRWAERRYRTRRRRRISARQARARSIPMRSIRWPKPMSMAYGRDAQAEEILLEAKDQRSEAPRDSPEAA